MTACEVNFDGLVGPTHNYSGLAFGNIASMKFGNLTSNPREAALQGLAKMKMIRRLGIPQGVLPPQERPNLHLLRSLGFTGPDAEVLSKAHKTAPQLLSACSSAASMWTANAATVSPSADSCDGKVHFTPANLNSHFHRSMEAEATSSILKQIFARDHFFVHHDPIPYFADEGAANHTRLTKQYGQRGVQLFTFGRSITKVGCQPSKFPARQTLEASEALMRLHQLDPEHVVYAKQSPEAIDAGVFHNDVISIGNENIFLYHEQAFVDTPAVIAEVRRKAITCGFEPIFYSIAADKLSLAEAVRTYLFNSQLITLPNGHMALIAPKEAEASAAVQQVLADLPIKQIHYVDLRQSMQNGGGPACLRLRVVLTDEEQAALHPGVMLTDKLELQLTDWINRFYRDSLQPSDLADPLLLDECRSALGALERILTIQLLR